jgi:hypothetical protein
MLPAAFFRRLPAMVLTKPELIESLQNEVRILLHLTTKVEPARLDYRPTPKQRSALELVKYLSIMGPELVKAAKRGTFDPVVWTAAEKVAQARDYEQTLEAIAAQTEIFPALLDDVSDDDMRAEIVMFGRKSTVGSFLVNSVLCGYAAYRTQLFLYLKSCGREELNTLNLWAGMDAPAAV